MRGALVLAVLALATGCLAPVTDVGPARPGGPAVTVWVVDHGWHTGILVRRADVDRTLWPVVDDFPAATFVEVAWGDRDFYMATPATVWMAVRAALGAGDSVLHVAGFDDPLSAVFPGREVVAVPVSPAGFTALTRFVSDEHARDADGHPVRLQPGLDGTSWFYAARGRYSLFNTCNTWIARALHAAGLPVTPRGVVTAAAVMDQLEPARLPP